ncbi:MAG: hypothetical protein J3K34DRAFT_194965 [Monoraphidium minutum]|nr:MAG: hypothetical protein J3K34DRAFT_194965 [Monoraphidium minutum]
MDALLGYGSETESGHSQDDEFHREAGGTSSDGGAAGAAHAAAARSAASQAAKRPRVIDVQRGVHLGGGGSGPPPKLPDPLALLSGTAPSDELLPWASAPQQRRQLAGAPGPPQQQSQQHQQSIQRQAQQSGQEQNQSQQQQQQQQVEEQEEEEAPASGSRGSGGGGGGEGAAAQAPPRPVRTFPHVEGNFATSVYIKLPQHRAVQELFEGLLAALPSGGGLPRFFPIAAAAPPGARPGGAPPPAPAPPHISLSRTAAVRREQAGPLLASLARRLKAAARPAALTLRGVRAFVNDERTRTFAALAVERGAPEVAALVRAVDAAFGEHGLPPFYEDPQPHASFAWALGDHGAALAAALAAAPPPHEPLAAAVAQVVCRVGRRESVVWSAPC